ncbi:MAG: hypothetical protein ACE5PT_14930 [Gemmatimonadales bacterium]
MSHRWYGMWEEAISELGERSLSVVWAQWAAVGAPASGGQRARSIVDPEALVLISLALREDERRLWDMLGWWAAEGVTLLSVQRMKNLASAYPGEVRHRLEEFAFLAYIEGRDYRWKTVPRTDPGWLPRPEKIRQGPVQLIEAPTVLLRLRSGFGVGVKADILAFLIGVGGAFVPVRDLARAVGYTTRAVRRATDDLGRARLIRTLEGQPVEYAVDFPAWLKLLKIEGEAPAWRYWQGVFAFVAQARHLSISLADTKPSDYIVSSELRRLVTEHESTFRWNRIPTPDPSRYPGESYLDGFEQTARVLGTWMEEHV